MRSNSVVVAITVMISVATAQAQEGGVVEPARPQRGDVPEGFRSILEMLNPVQPRDRSSILIEGLARDSASERLTWERACKLALVRSREPGRPMAPTLDPKAVDEAADRLGFADFARFRREFLDRGTPAFASLSARHFDLLARSQAVVHSRDRLAALENLLRLLQELIRGEASGLTQLQMDQANESIQRARLDVLDRQSRHRDALDAAKVELGLAPSAPVFLDLAPVEGFASVFEQLTRWSADPSRELSQLDQIVSSLPDPTDMQASGLSLTASARSPRPIEGSPASFIDAVGRLAAVRHPGEVDARSELEARRQARKLQELAVAYWVEHKRLILIVRTKSQAIEMMLGLPGPGQPREAAANLMSLLEAQDQLCGSQDRLVEGWASYHAGRLALLRDLDLLTAQDWDQFRREAFGTASNSRRSGPIPTAVPGPAATRPDAPAPPPAPLPPTPPR